jgi:CubicO group peptidase (beta-lactamase class C family)
VPGHKSSCIWHYVGRQTDLEAMLAWATRGFMSLELVRHSLASELRWGAAVCLLCMGCCSIAAANKATSPACPPVLTVAPLPRHAGFDPKGLIHEWTVLGPFPNPEQGGKRLGIDVDCLGSLGGEARAEFAAGLTLSSADGVEAPLPASKIEAPDGHVDFERAIGKLDHRLAYALAHLNSDRDQEIRFYLGSDDGAKVWVNGRQVLRVVTPGRPLIPGQDRFVAPLHAGSNRVLVKVEDGTGDWGFVLQAFDDAAYQANQRPIDITKALMSGTIHPKGKWDYMFSAESFPEIGWKFEEGATEDPNAIPDLNVRWFNARLEEETTPSGPGRYMAYAQGRTKDGTLVRRAQTFFCRPQAWQPWHQNTRAFLSFIPGSPFDERAWKQYGETVAGTLGSALVQFLETEERGAVITSYLHEARPAGTKPRALDDPDMVAVEAQWALRRKILGLKAPVLLKPPEILPKPSPVVRVGTPNEANITRAAMQKIRTAARLWYDDSREPFVVAVSRNGVLFLHEPFGEVTRETEFPWASITKFVGGILVARFVDQGLVQLDDPIGKHLPDWPTSGPKAITLRQCFTHTSGIGALGEAPLEGPWSDNQVYEALRLLVPGKRFEYSSLGYAVIAKVMESITGQSTRRLVFEQIFEPIGGKPSGPTVLGYGINAPAFDLVRLGQLVLNRGSYGNKQLFSAETYQALLPRPLHEFYPGLDPTLRVGIGVAGMIDKDPRAGKDGFAADKVLLSPNTVGHGAGSSTVFRVDPDHQLVVAVARRRAGHAYDEHLSVLLQAVDAAVHEAHPE